MNKLIFVTSKYPFASSETFIENEIKYLSEAFDKVYIFASEAEKNDNIRPVPENVTVFPTNRGEISKTDYIPQLFKAENIKEICQNCIGKNMFSKVSAVCYFSACVTKSLKNVDDFIESCDIKSGDTVTVYSYWLSTIGMCALRIKSKIESLGITVRAVSRCHGFDLYPEHSDIGYLAFQKYMIGNFDSIYPCSRNGETYLTTKFPLYADKISTQYLGIKDCFNGIFPQKKDIFNIVSCANIKASKRVDKIIKMLCAISNKKICWTHFGDGKLFDAVKSEAENILPENIIASFPGRVSNAEIYKYYNENNINLFIAVGSREGLPVSIMEAVSFGIPVIATDVGGTGEIVFDGENGFLLQNNFELSSLKDLFQKVLNMDKDKYNSFCFAARKTFENNFDANINYLNFTKIIKGEDKK